MTSVLVVDDAEDVRLLLRTVLSRADCVVTEADGGREALQLLMSDLPDVVVLDIQMPDIDGWETLIRLRKDPRTANLPVLLCTVKAQVEDHLHGWKLGCDGFLTKPFAIADVVSAVASVAARPLNERLAVRRRALANITELEAADQ